MAPVRGCDDHGYFKGEECPVCGKSGRVVLDSDRRTRLSKFMSGALRHFPDDVGLSLDEHGWTEYEAVVSAAREQYDWADREAIEAMVATDPKGRFERANGRVRAAYGHSVEVDLDAPETPVPEELYHGTDPGTLDAILAEGLKPMDRQQVHLSRTIEEAREVGRRHADDPVALVVDAAAMEADGERIVRRGEGVYTTDRVPPEYLHGLE